MKNHPLINCPARWLPRLSGGLLAALGLSTAIGQTTPMDEMDVVTLPGYTVQTNRGDYRNTHAVTASRIAAPIRETPLSITAIGEEFLRDTGVQEFRDAFRYSPGVSVDPDNQGQAVPGIRIRGLSTGYILRNGFTKWYHQNLDGVDRIEVVRGPVSAFYGKAEPGGVINYQTKRPQFDWQQTIKAQYGRDDFFKVWLDSTGPIYKDKLAYLIVTTKTDSKHWKDFVEDDRVYFLGGLLYRPTDRITLNVDYEYDKRKQRGGRNTALVINERYIGDYEFYQRFAEDNNWKQVMRINNATATSPATVVHQNIVHGQTRYPVPYSINDFAWAGTTAQQWTAYANFLANYAVNPEQKTVRDFNNDAEAFAKYLEPRSWMTVGAPDPRTGKPQQPILDLFSQVATMNNGRYSPAASGTPQQMRNYLHGWRSLEYFASIGAYDKATGQFINIEDKIDRSNPASMPEGNLEPRFTANHFPLGYAFNPNGINSFGIDDNHIATAELTMRLTDWLNVRFASNYYENTTNYFRTFNSDTRMDGFSLNSLQGLGAFGLELGGAPDDPRNQGNTLQFSGAAGLEHYNRRYTHQVDMNIDFDFAGASHSVLFLAEYRDEYYIQRLFVTSPYAVETGVVRPGRFAEMASIPGITMWDIYNDPAPLIGLYADPHAIRVRGGSSNARVEHGFSASYRGRFLNDALHVWTGVRHEREDVWNALDVDKSRLGAKSGANFTSPMYGLSYRILPGVNLFASYSESYVAAAAGQRNSPYRNPDNLGDPNDLILVPNPAPVKGTGYEAGVKFEVMDGKILGSAVVFSLERTGEVNNDSSLVASINRAYEIWQEQTGESIPAVSGIFLNLNSRRIEGFELELTYSPIRNFQLVSSFSYYWTRKFFDISTTTLVGNIREPALISPTAPLPHLSQFVWDPIYGGYRPKAESEKDGTEIYPVKFNEVLAGVPEMTFRVWGKYNFTEGRLKGISIGGGLSHESKSPVSNDWHSSPWYNPATYLVDMLLAYKFDLGPGRMGVSLNVTNLLNRKYTKSSFGIIDPIRYQLTVDYSF